MTFVSTAKAKALGPGALLWIIPDIENSEISREIDWYLNFQIARAKNRKSVIWSKELRSLVDQLKLQLKPSENKNFSSLLIPAHKQLQCEMIIELSYQDTEQWVESCYQHWLQLSKPSLRIFLPPYIDIETFKKKWPTPPNPLFEISVVSS